jgi:putative membrane protein
MWGNQMMSGAWWGMGLYMGLFWVLVLAAVVALALVLVRRQSSSAQHARRRKSARAILEERYARGEIGSEEFEQKKRDLRS